MAKKAASITVDVATLGQKDKLDQLSGGMVSQYEKALGGDIKAATSLATQAAKSQLVPGLNLPDFDAYVPDFMKGFDFSVLKDAVSIKPVPQAPNQNIDIRVPASSSAMPIALILGGVGTLAVLVYFLKGKK